ncbi:MAG: M28 family peptidase, partial [Negativicutes bacterium]|nr:M28 family peptidase [Negativicutes bacterium]
MLKTITDSEEGITRLAFTDMDWRGRDYIKSLMADAGLTIREDAFGNVIGRLPGRNESLPSIMSGSHTDSVPRGGNYDGVVGVLSALEVARLLQDETGK